RLTVVRDRAAARHEATGSPLARAVALGAQAVAVGRHRDPEIAAFLNFDWYAPQYRSYHTADEGRRWYDEADFVDVRLLPQPVSAIGVRRGLDHTVRRGAARPDPRGGQDRFSRTGGPRDGPACAPGRRSATYGRLHAHVSRRP